MSSASTIGLNPKNPVVISVTSTIGANSTAFNPYPQSFTPSISATAPYQLTTEGLTFLNVAQWNALTTSNYTLSGQSNNIPVIYEIGSFTGGSSSTAQTLNYEATPLQSQVPIQTNPVNIKFIIPSII